MCGVGCSILGYSHRSVVRDLKRELVSGSHSTLNSNKELICAEEFLKLNRWGDKVRFFRSGGEACAAAVRISRSSTDKTKVLVHGYHGWHDWYLSAALSNKTALDNFLLPDIPLGGVPRQLDGTVEAIQDLSAESVLASINSSHNQVAALILEIGRLDMPDASELAKIRKVCTDRNVLLFSMRLLLVLD